MNNFVKGDSIFTSGVARRYKTGHTTYKSSYRDFYTVRKIETPYYKDIIIKTLGDAEDVLSYVSDIFEDYGFVSVADLYDFCGIPSNFKDYKIGWKDSYSVSKMRVLKTKTKHGYRLKLPKPVELV